MESKESKEKELNSRKVVLHFVRHGDAGYSGRSDAEGYLTDKGREQAERVGEEIYQELPEGSIVEFLSSNRKRAVETVEAIKEKIGKLNQEQDKKLVFHSDKVKSYERLGISDKVTQEILALRRQGNNEINYWLEHPGETPDEVKKNLNSFLKHIANFSNHLKSGPDVHIIFAIHSGPTEVFLGNLVNDPQVRPLANCEQFTIDLPVAKNQAVINYKDQKREIVL